MYKLAEGLNSESPKEMLAKAEQFKRARTAFAALGDFSDAAERVKDCTDKIEDILCAEIDKNKVTKKKAKGRVVADMLLLAIPAVLFVMVPMTIFYYKGMSAYAQSNAENWFIGAWVGTIAFIMFALVAVFFTRSNNRKP